MRSLPPAGIGRVAVLVAAALVLVTGVQVTRALLVPAPSLDFDDGELITLRFADEQCSAATAVPAGTSGGIADKWAWHPGDGGRTTRCVSDSFQPGDWPSLLVRYAGNPGDDDIRIGLDLDQDGSIDRPWALGAAARHGWLVSAVPLPPEARGRTARLVIDDRSDRAGGWVVIRDVVQFAGASQGLSGIEAWPATFAAAFAMALAAAVMWLAYRGHSVAAAAGMAALLAVEFLQMSSFYFTDEYVLLSAFADGIRWRDLVSYYDQFAPLFLSLYAVSVALVGEWYAPLQVAMLAGHLAVCLALARLLGRHGFSRWIAISVTLLYATSSAHIDVVPWFMESCFLVSTGLTLVALERAAARTQRSPGSLPAALVAATLAPFVFAGGIVAPWLCLAYVLLFDRRDRRAAALFGTTGVLSLLLIVLSSTALDSARAVAANAPVGDMVMFVVRGALASSLASLLALRGSFWLAALVLAGIGAAIALCCGVRSDGGRTARSLAFAGAWMVAAYALQAVVRTGTGFGEAMAFRYTYFGMTGAAFALAAWLNPLASAWRARAEPLRRLLAGVCVTAALFAVGANTWTFVTRSDTQEREYFEINRQYFALTRSALAWSDARRVQPSPGIVPKTLFPGAQAPTAEMTGQYREVVCYLANCAAGKDAGEVPPSATAGSQAVWNALLSP